MATKPTTRPKSFPRKFQVFNISDKAAAALAQVVSELSKSPKGRALARRAGAGPTGTDCNIDKTGKKYDFSCGDEP